MTTFRPLHITTFAITLLINTVATPSAGRCDTLGQEMCEMVTEQTVLVYRAPNRNTAVIAKIYPRTKLMANKLAKMQDCPEGWYGREGNGYICGKHLRPVKPGEDGFSREDSPEIRNGMSAGMITARKSKVYRKSKRTGGLKSIEEVIKGSILSGTPDVEIDDTLFFETRQGLYVPMENVSLLPEPIETLAIPVPSPEQAPVAVVIGDAPTVFETPRETSAPLRTLTKWQAVLPTGSNGIEDSGEFVKLPQGGFVKKDQLSLVREVPRPKKMIPDEKWIAVDLREQLLFAFEGDRLIRLIPCSTGVRDNTDKGHFVIQKKIRQQTMRLRAGKQRVEDVQWVMYYDKDNAIAIHSAYWHREFGTPKSHGCVNLPTDDARWLFEWSDPPVSPSDSETIPLPRESGTKVIVF